MKRFLSVFMAAVMACSLCVMSASANYVSSPERPGRPDKDDKPVVVVPPVEPELPEEPEEPGVIVLQPNEVRMLRQELDLPQDEPVQWTTDRPDIVTIDEEGSVTNNNTTGGDVTVTITARAGDKEFTYTLVCQSAEAEPVQPEAPEGTKPVSPQTGYTVGVLGLAAVAALSGAVAVAAGKKANKG